MMETRARASRFRAALAVLLTAGDAAGGGVVRSGRDELTFPLWCLRTVKGLRPHTTIVDVRGLGPTIGMSDPSWCRD